MELTTTAIHRYDKFLCSFPTPSSPHHSLPAASKSLHFRTSTSSLSSSPPPPCTVTRVSTAPVEFAPPAPDFDFGREIARLRGLRSRLDRSSSFEGKSRAIDADSRVRDFFGCRRGGFAEVLGPLELDARELFLLKCVVAAGQEHVFGSGLDFVRSDSASSRSSLKSVLYTLVEMIEKWDPNGGDGGLGRKNNAGLKDEEIGALKKLLKTLEDIEQFYNCIGGIIG